LGRADLLQTGFERRESRTIRVTQGLELGAEALDLLAQLLLRRQRLGRGVCRQDGHGRSE
jgi:hypothetical protein